MRVILLKNPSGQKVTVKKTISDVSPGNSNRVQTKLARKNSRQFSCIFTHLQKRGVLQQNRECHIEHCRSSRLPSAQTGGTRGLGKNMTISLTDPFTPGYASILGAALATNTVTVNSASADRKIEYFHDE